MQIVNKKGVGDSLCNIFHPKCFKTTNFDRFRYGVSLRYVGYSFMLRSPNQRANQTRRSFKNEEFDWLFDFVTVT